MKLILYSAWLCLAACNVKNDTEVPQTALIVDQNLAEAYQDVQAAMTKKRTPIEFQGGEVATDCARYMTLRSNRNLVEGVNNKIIKSEYVICEARSEEHKSELQSRGHLVCRLLLEKRNIGEYH